MLQAQQAESFGRMVQRAFAGDVWGLAQEFWRMSQQIAIVDAFHVCTFEEAHELPLNYVLLAEGTRAWPGQRWKMQANGPDSTALRELRTVWRHECQVIPYGDVARPTPSAFYVPLVSDRPVGTISPKSYSENAFSSDAVDVFERFATVAAPLLSAALEAGSDGGPSARAQKRGILQGIALVKARLANAAPELFGAFAHLFEEPVSSESHGVAGLTERQNRILALVANGLTNPQIGNVEHISASLVGHELTIIMRALNVSSRAAAARVYERICSDI